MPIIAMSAGRVTAIWGKAHVQLPDGSLKPLQVGDKVAGGARIVTDDNGIVEISPTRGPSVLMKDLAGQTSVDRALAGIDADDPKQAPAAGLAAGDAPGAEGGLSPGLRVTRVSESADAGRIHAFGSADTTPDGAFGSSADQRLRPVSLTFTEPQPVDPTPEPLRLVSVDVRAADDSYVYFGIQLAGASTVPTTLTLQLSPGARDATTGDAWTGELSYSLDALDGLQDDITFIPWRAMPDVSEGAVSLVVPPLAEGGLVLVKVPVFLQSDVNLPHVDDIVLSASIKDDPVSLAASHPLLHQADDVRPDVLITDAQVSEEGGALLFDVWLSHAISSDVQLHLAVTDGDDDPFTPGNERALAGVDTDLALMFRASDTGNWQPLVDGVLTIPAGQDRITLRLMTVDDAFPEDTEYVRLSIVKVDGDLTANQTHSHQVAIVDNDQAVDPIRGVLAVMPEVVPVDLRDLPQSVDGSAHVATLSLPIDVLHPQDVLLADTGAGELAGLLEACLRGDATPAVGPAQRAEWAGTPAGEQFAPGLSMFSLMPESSKLLFELV